MPVLALCTDERIRRRLTLLWGVESERTEEIQRHGAHGPSSRCARRWTRCGAQPGDTVVIVGGTPYQVSGRTNLIKVETVPPEGQEIPDEF